MNQQIRQDVKQWHRDRAKAKKAKLQAGGHDSDEEKKTEKTDKEWWDVPSNIPTGSYGDEAQWNWWRDTGKVADLQEMINH